MSTATSDATTEAEQYLREVAPHLANMPADERADLLEDLAQHLREIAAEPGPPLAERLGAPEAYAAELLASAGIAADEGSRGRAPLLTRASASVERARRSWVGQEAVRLWPVLQPAWWVVRAYLAVALLSATERHGADPGFPVPRVAGNIAVGLAALLVAIPLSVRLGQRRVGRSGRLALIGANVVLVIYALSLLGGSGANRVQYVGAKGTFVQPFGQGCLTTASGDKITNIYAYDTDGRLLDPVLLYDQNGQPIDNLCPDVDERGRALTNDYRQDVNGAPVLNAFPRRQSASLTPEQPSRPAVPRPPGVTVPVRPPAVVVPRLAPTTTTTVAVPG